MKKKILFVDDDEDILFSYGMAVESDENDIYTACDVNAALDIVRQTKIDLAILDYMMPGLNGDELALQINKIDPGVKIFFISGFDIALEAVRKLDVSVYGVFMKPVDLDTLSRIVETDFDSVDYHTVIAYGGNLYSNFYAAHNPNITNIKNLKYLSQSQSSSSTK